MNATIEQVDALKKSVADLSELVKSSKEGYQETVKNVLEQVLAAHPGFTPPSKMEHPTSAPSRREEILMGLPKDLQTECDNIMILSKMLRREPQHLKSWGKFSRQMGDFKKALDTAAAGGGLEWVPTEFSNNLYEYVRLQTKVVSLFPQIDMPSNPYKLPIQVGRIQTYKQPEQTGDTGQTTIPVGDGSTLTGNVTLTAVGHAAFVITSKDLEEDSIIPILPWLRSEIITSLAEGREDCTLNGDIVSGTHEDTDISSADDRRKMWTGLRALSHDNSYAVDLSELSDTTINNLLRAPMGKFGVNPADLAIVTGIGGYVKLMGIPNVQTVDKYGAGATILSGELAKINGIPVIVSEWVREDLDANGLYVSGGSKTVIHLVNRRGFAFGTRRSETAIQLLVELFARSDQDALKIRERVVFSPTYALASNKTIYTGQNV